MLALSSPLSAQMVVRLATFSTAATLDVENDTVDLNPSIGIGLGSLGIEVRGTWTGTIAVECNAAYFGGTYVALAMTPRNSATAVTSTTANGQWSAIVAGCQRIRARATAAMTGVAIVTLVGSYQ
jgi:hypothetical protein